MDPGDDTPLSVSKHFFQKACPNSTIIRVEDVNTYDMRFSETMPVTETFNAWVETLKAVDDPCLMLDPSSHHVFDNWYVQSFPRYLFRSVYMFHMLGYTVRRSACFPSGRPSPIPRFSLVGTGLPSYIAHIPETATYSNVFHFRHIQHHSSTHRAYKCLKILVRPKDYSQSTCGEVTLKNIVELWPYGVRIGTLGILSQNSLISSKKSGE